MLIYNYQNWQIASRKRSLQSSLLHAKWFFSGGIASQRGLTSRGWLSSFGDSQTPQLNLWLKPGRVVHRRTDSGLGLEGVACNSCRFAKVRASYLLPRLRALRATPKHPTRISHAP